MLVQVYGDNAWRKQQFTSGRKVFLREEKVSLTKRDQDGEQRAELKKKLQKLVKLCVKIIGWLSGAWQSKWTSTEKQLAKSELKILTWGRCVQNWSQRSSPKNKSEEQSQFAETFRRGKMTFWAVSSPNSPWPKIPSVQIKSQNNVADFFLILQGLFIMNLYQLDKQSTKFTIWKYWKGCVKKVRWKWPELSVNNSCILHHDSAPAHTALSVREFLATKQITVLEHLAYSPDRVPNDFFLFPKIKEILKGRHFDDTDNTRNNTTAALKAIPQNQFQNCFEGWTKRWNRCIASLWEFFEGDHGGIR